jgi:hypothetical protein
MNKDTKSISFILCLLKQARGALAAEFQDRLDPTLTDAISRDVTWPSSQFVSFPPSMIVKEERQSSTHTQHRAPKRRRLIEARSSPTDTPLDRHCGMPSP